MVVRSFRFTGRLPLMGTVQLWSKTRAETWMDSIIVRCPRRELWLENLALLSTKSCVNDVQVEDLVLHSGVDPSWLKFNVNLARQCFAIVSRELTKALAQPRAGV